MARHPIAIIVLAQLFGTSLWFSANAAGEDLLRTWALQPADIGRLTIAVQLGFIAGTLGFSLSGLADRFPASRIFAVCAVVGAVANAGFALLAQGLGDGLAWRFAVGLALAGVYPLGMKLVVSWVPQQAGAALAWLVGMLTLGTALPHWSRRAGSPPRSASPSRRCRSPSSASVHWVACSAGTSRHASAAPASPPSRSPPRPRAASSSRLPAVCRPRYCWR
jgi:hypothetical protein